MTDDDAGGGGNGDFWMTLLVNDPLSPSACVSKGILHTMVSVRTRVNVGIRVG